MNKFLALALLSVAGTAQAQNVLWFEDFRVGPNSAYEDALNNLGWSYTHVTDASSFAAALGSGSWTHVISANQNYSGTSGIIYPALNAWVTANPGAPVLISDWTGPSDATTQAGLAAMGFGVDGITNFSQITPVAGETLDGLGVASLTNPGWGIFSTGTTGSVTIGTTEFGGGAVQRNGCLFLNGFMSDTFSNPAQGMEYVRAELLCIPSPASLALLGLGGLAAARRRR